MLDHKLWECDSNVNENLNILSIWFLIYEVKYNRLQINYILLFYLCFLCYIYIYIISHCWNWKETWHLKDCLIICIIDNGYELFLNKLLVYWNQKSWKWLPLVYRYWKGLFLFCKTLPCALLIYVSLSTHKLLLVWKYEDKCLTITSLVSPFICQALSFFHILGN